MAFPDTAILDSGVGAGANPIGGNWTANIEGDDNALERSSSQIKSSSGESSGYWNPASYGPVVEVRCTMPTMIFSSGNYVGVYALAQSLGTAGLDGYAVFADVSSGDGINVYRIDNGAYTPITSLGAPASIPGTFANGDSIGLLITADGSDNIVAYHKTTAGAWTEIVSLTDTTYTASGRIGMMIGGTTIRVTNFGGGTVGGVDPNTNMTPTVGTQTLTGIAPRMDLGIRPLTLLRG